MKYIDLPMEHRREARQLVLDLINEMEEDQAISEGRYPRFSTCRDPFFYEVLDESEFVLIKDPLCGECVRFF